MDAGPLPRLPNSVQLTILSYLSPNEIACTARLINKASALHFTSDNHGTVRLSQPIPAHAFKFRWRPGSPAWRALGYQSRLKLLCLTATSGVQPNLDLAVRGAGCVPTSKVLEAAAAAGHLATCQALCKLGCPWGAALATAARAGRRDVIEWLLANGCALDRTAVEAAARGGHVELMEWLLEQLPPDQPVIRRFLLGAVAEGCDLAALQQQYTRHTALEPSASPSPSPSLTLSPSVSPSPSLTLSPSPSPRGSEDKSGLEPQQQHQQRGKEQRGKDLEEVRALQRLQQRQHQSTLRPQEPQQLIERLTAQDLEKQLRQQLAGPNLDGRVVILAAATGSLTPDWQAKVEWLESLGCPRDAPWPACAAAGCADALARLQWLRKRGYGVDQRAVEFAAWRGNVAAVKYLLEVVGVRVVSEGAVRCAAAGGHLGALKALLRRSCPVNLRAATVAAVRAGHLEVVAWMVEALGVPVGELPTSVFDDAARSGDVRLMAWLWDRGCRWGGGTLTAAALGGCEEALEWLAERGCPLEGGFEKPYGWAAFNQDHATLRCLSRLGCPKQGNGHPYYAAAKHNDLATLRVLHAELSYPLNASPALFADWASRGVPLPSLQWLVEEAGCRPDAGTMPALPPAVREWLVEEQLRRGQQAARRQLRAVAALVTAMVAVPVMPMMFGAMVGARVAGAGAGGMAYVLSVVVLVMALAVMLPRSRP